jgi:hypothetical protein
MTPIESQVLSKVTTVLTNLGLEWAIKTSDGEVHGNLKIEPPKEAKPKKREPIYPYGTLKAHLDAQGIGNITINTHKVISTGNMDAEVVRRSICSYGSQHWGNGTYKTAITADRKGIEITRFDKQTAKFMKEDPLAELLSGLEAPQEPKKSFIDSLRLPPNFRPSR